MQSCSRIEHRRPTIRPNTGCASRFERCGLRPASIRRRRLSTLQFSDRALLTQRRCARQSLRDAHAFALRFRGQKFVCRRKIYADRCLQSTQAECELLLACAACPPNAGAARSVHKSGMDQFCSERKIDDSDGAFSIEKLSISTMTTMVTK